MASHERILIFKPDNIGDVVLFSGALKHFRRLFPATEIVLAVRQHVLNLIEMCPYIDRVVAVESLAPVDLMAGAGSLRSRLVHLFRRFFRTSLPCYDAVYYPVRAPQPVHLAILRQVSARKVYGIVGCRVNAPTGYPSGLSPEELYTDRLDVSERDPWEHEFEVLRLFMNHLGGQLCGLEQLRPEFWPAPGEQSLLPASVRSAGPVLGLFPFASGPERCWPMDRYLPLLQRLPRVKSVVLFGSSDKAAAADALELELQRGLAGIKVFNLAGRTTLRQLAMTIADCSVMVSVDSCGLHMSLASGVATVGVVGGGHYGMFAPWGDPQQSTILANRLPCFNCNWNCCRATHECIDCVSPEDVADAVGKLMRQTGAEVS